ncbi:MAG: alpha/beta fold hydrolase [Gemmatimonadetes bacterium]|nr:alpha/beta fold hydrolase [Gemmatimonadota bacterium]
MSRNGARALAVVGLLTMAVAAPAQDSGSGYVTVGADRLWFHEAGSGEAVILLHDGLVHSAGMEDLQRSLSTRFRVIRYDRRGYGRSDTPTEPFSPVTDVLAVLDHLDVDRGVLVGASSGGGGAIEVALARPDRTSALVLLGAVVVGHPYSGHFRRRGRRNMEPATRGDFRSAMRNWIEDPYLLADDRVDARERLWSIVEPYAEKHLTIPFDLAELPARVAADRLGEVRAPTLVVVGEADIPDVHAHAGVIEAGVRDSRRVVLEDAGHLLFFERPDAVSRLIVEFLEGANPEGGGGP